jgi:uncharacterized protein YqeY
MLLEQLERDLLIARKQGDDRLKIDLLRLVYSDAKMVGKNNGNRESTDEEVMAVLKKFKVSAQENIKLLKDEVRISVSKEEIKIIDSYLPKQLSEEELEQIIREWYFGESVISEVLNEVADISPKSIGKIMKFLKEQYSGQFDGGNANKIIQKVLGELK